MKTHTLPYESTLQLFKASKRNIIIWCWEKICIYKINGVEKQS